MEILVAASNCKQDIFVINNQMRHILYGFINVPTNYIYECMDKVGAAGKTE